MIEIFDPCLSTTIIITISINLVLIFLFSNKLWVSKELPNLFKQLIFKSTIKEFWKEIN